MQEEADVESRPGAIYDLTDEISCQAYRLCCLARNAWPSSALANVNKILCDISEFAMHKKFRGTRDCNLNVINIVKDVNRHPKNFQSKHQLSSAVLA